MAINFLNNISLNKAQLENARVQNLAGDPDITGTVAQKQATLGLIYFKSNGSAAQGIRVFTQTAFESGAETFAWTDVGGAITLTGNVTGSGSGTIATTIADNAVVTAKINNGAVIASKIGSSAVTTAKINDGAVTSGKIASGVIPTSRPNATPLVYNGNCAVAQRGISQTGVSSGANYPVDRFQLYPTNLGAYTITQEALTSGNAFSNGS
jgi:hypothetical protein